MPTPKEPVQVAACAPSSQGGVPVDGRVSDDEAVERRRRGTTPLTVASRQGHLDVVQCLIAAGAAVGHTNDDGDNALTLSADEGDLSIASSPLVSPTHRTPSGFS